MEETFRSYWWLLFPIGFFIFGAWDRWLAYQRSRDHLELLKSQVVSQQAEEGGLRGLQGVRLGGGAR